MIEKSEKVYRPRQQVDTFTNNIGEKHENKRKNDAKEKI